MLALDDVFLLTSYLFGLLDRFRSILLGITTVRYVVNSPLVFNPEQPYHGREDPHRYTDN